MNCFFRRRQAHLPQTRFGTFPRRKLGTKFPRQDDENVSEQGSALVESTMLIGLVILPLLYLVLAVLAVQAASYTATSVARQSARAYATGDAATALQRAKMAEKLTFADYGQQGKVEFSCARTPCFRSGNQIRARVEVIVHLPLAPAWLQEKITVTAQHVETIDIYVPSS